jgi:hypothetical protein
LNRLAFMRAPIASGVPGPMTPQNSILLSIG